MAAGTRADGSDAVAHPLPEAADWPLRLVVALTATGPKAIGSTAAMDRTAATSPYYAAWLASVPGDLAEARAAIAARDLPRLGAVVERSALRMHASAMAAEPPILYWTPATLAAMQAVHRARRERACWRISRSTPARTSRRCAGRRTLPRWPPCWRRCPACCAR